MERGGGRGRGGAALISSYKSEEKTTRTKPAIEKGVCT